MNSYVESILEGAVSKEPDFPIVREGIVVSEEIQSLMLTCDSLRDFSAKDDKLDYLLAK